MTSQTHNIVETLRLTCR